MVLAIKLILISNGIIITNLKKEKSHPLLNGQRHRCSTQVLLCSRTPT